MTSDFTLCVALLEKSVYEKNDNDTLSITCQIGGVSYNEKADVHL